jgi:PIN domain nuclease of toxin-antitoxin system
MSGVLLDTNALIWLTTRAPMALAALDAIASAQHTESILVSPISAWETGLAVLKPRGRPDLGQQDVARWFRSALRAAGIKLAPLNQRIAIEAATVPAVFGHGDPGDCFIIATARVRKVPIVTRDRRMAMLAGKRPEYLQVIPC